jgi:hypothetical protein
MDKKYNSLFETTLLLTDEQPSEYTWAWETTDEQPSEYTWAWETTDEQPSEYTQAWETTLRDIKSVKELMFVYSEGCSSVNNKVVSSLGGFSTDVLTIR